MDEIRLEIRVKNNRLWKALDENYGLAAKEAKRALCAFSAIAIGVPYSELADLLAFRTKPWRKDGKLTPTAFKTSDAVGVPVDHLFPEWLYDKAKGKMVVKTIDAPEFISIGNHEVMAISAPDSLMSEELAATLEEVVSTLNPKEQYVIRKRMGMDGDPSTFSECAQGLGVSVERCRQIESAAFRKLRDPSRCNKLKPFIGWD